MQRNKATSAFQEEEKHAGEQSRVSQRLGDIFIVDEILPRLPAPAHAARAFAAASKTLRGVLTDPDYWLTTARALQPLPRYACLVVRGADRHEFHYADPCFSAGPTVRSAADDNGPSSSLEYTYAGTCNGLVLLASPCNQSNGYRASAVLFNPVTGKEETVVLDLRAGGGAPVCRRFCGFGYSPSTKTYKALVYQNCGVFCGKLMVLPFVPGRREPRTVATLSTLHMPTEFEPNFATLNMDGKIYVLADISDSPLLVFDVGDETVTRSLPPDHREYGPFLSLMEVWGRPCAVSGLEGAFTFWVLTADPRWERRCTIAGVAPRPHRVLDNDALCDYECEVLGAWDCGDGFLFALFDDGRGFLYDLRQQDTPPAHGVIRHTRQLHKAEDLRCLAELREGTATVPTFCWGYVPTLVPPATVFGDGGDCPDERVNGWGHFVSDWRWRRMKPPSHCLEALMEMMRKR